MLFCLSVLKELQNYQKKLNAKTIFMKDVIIIGGGVAGVNAAYRLQESGRQVTLVESGSKIGGRINSRIDEKTGDSIDNGQHLLVGAYTEFISLLKILGTFKDLFIQDDLLIKYFSKDEEFELASSGPGDIGMLVGLMRLKYVSLRSKLNAILFILRVKSGSIRSQGKTCLELLKENSQGDDLIKILWEPLILATINTSIQEADAFIFTEVMRLSFFGKSDHGKLIFPKVGLHELLDPFYDKFAKMGGELKLNSTMKSFSKQKDHWFVELSKGESIQCKVLYLAIPASRIKYHSVPEFEYSPIISVYLWYDKNFMKEKIAAMIDSKTQWVFNKRELGFHDGENEFPGYITCTISAADDILKMSSEEIANICDQEIKEFMKVDAKLLHFKVIKEKYATLKQDLYSSEVRRSFKSNDPSLKFIGDWVWTGLPCTIESACRSFDIGKKSIR